MQKCRIDLNGASDWIYSQDYRYMHLRRLRSELKHMEQHKERLVDKLSKQSIFEQFLMQVMSASSEFIDIRSIISRYHTLKQLYEVH